MTTLIRFAIACAAVPIGLTAQSATEARSSKNPSLEQRVRALEDKEAILKVMYQYAYTIDFGHDVNEYTDLYTDDAVFQGNAPANPPAGASAREGRGAVLGRQGLEKWITNEWQGRERLIAAGHYRVHAMVEPDITLDGDHASVRSYFLTTDNDNGRIYMVSIGVYKDEFVRSPDGRWRMKERLLVRQGAVNGAGAPGGGGRNPAPAQQ